MVAKGQAGEWPPKSISEEKVKAATGRGWMGWFVILNNMKATELPHKEVAKRLKEDHGAPSWWCQMIAVEYERARGGRKKNERAGGTYAVNVTKVMPVALPKLFARGDGGENAQGLVPGRRVRGDEQDERQILARQMEEGPQAGIRLLRQG